MMAVEHIWGLKKIIKMLEIYNSFKILKYLDI
jgi:hypothetical protein